MHRINPYRKQDIIFEKLLFFIEIVTADETIFICVIFYSSYSTGVDLALQYRLDSTRAIRNLSLTPLTSF